MPTGKRGRGRRLLVRHARIAAVRPSASPINRTSASSTSASARCANRRDLRSTAGVETSPRTFDRRLPRCGLPPQVVAAQSVASIATPACNVPSWSTNSHFCTFDREGAFSCPSARLQPPRRVYTRPLFYPFAWPNCDHKIGPRGVPNTRPSRWTPRRGRVFFSPGRRPGDAGTMPSFVSAQRANGFLAANGWAGPRSRDAPYPGGAVNGWAFGRLTPADACLVRMATEGANNWPIESVLTIAASLRETDMRILS